MGANTCIHKLAEISGLAQSEDFHRMLESAMTDEEARFILEMLKPNAPLAAKFNMTERDAEKKIMGLAKRGFFIPSLDPSTEGRHCSRSMPALFQENVLSSLPRYVLKEFQRLWLALYEREEL